MQSEFAAQERHQRQAGRGQERTGEPPREHRERRETRLQGWTKLIEKMEKAFVIWVRVRHVLVLAVPVLCCSVLCPALPYCLFCCDVVSFLSFLSCLVFYINLEIGSFAQKVHKKLCASLAHIRRHPMSRLNSIVMAPKKWLRVESDFPFNEDQGLEDRVVYDWRKPCLRLWHWWARRGQRYLKTENRLSQDSAKTQPPLSQSPSKSISFCLGSPPERETPIVYHFLFHLDFRHIWAFILLTELVSDLHFVQYYNQPTHA